MAGSTRADSKFIWMDGQLVPYADAKVPVLAHSLHYGSGAFEGIRAYQLHDGRTGVFRLEDHLKRFLDSIRVLGYQSPYTLGDYRSACCEVVRANEFKECYLRPLAYIDDSVRGLRLPDEPKVNSAIAAWSWGKYMGTDGQKNGVRVGVSTYRRPDIATSLPWAKLTGGYLTSVLARQEATRNQFDEALLLDPRGFVAEGSGENVFIVQNGVLFTPPPGFILPGLTRDSVIQIAHWLGYTVNEANITRNQVYLADEVFFTGTAVEVNPIREVDHRRIGDGKPGPITRNLMDFFFKAVRGEVPEFTKWLTIV